jgi:hypothetical protein
MTKLQLVALAFPLATAALAGLTGLAIMRMVNRRYEREKAAEAMPIEQSLDLETAFREVHSAIDTAQRRIHKALTP